MAAVTSEAGSALEARARAREGGPHRALVALAALGRCRHVVRVGGRAVADDLGDRPCAQIGVGASDRTRKIGERFAGVDDLEPWASAPWEDDPDWIFAPGGSAEALLKGGVDVVEVTLNTAGAAQMVSEDSSPHVALCRLASSSRLIAVWSGA